MTATTYIPRKGTTPTLDDIDFAPAHYGERVLVCNADGRWSFACPSGETFAIYAEADHTSAFAALMAENIVYRHPKSGKWTFIENVRHF